MTPKIFQIDEYCTGCGSCTDICPKRCIVLKPNEDGFYYPSYNSNGCIECGLCEKVCHVVNPPSVEKDADPDNFYIYHSNDDQLLQQSSSGGAFSLFADWIMSEGGVVYGSAYNGEQKRLEVTSTDRTDIRLIRKSKYIESYVGSSFVEIKEQLNVGRRVLYCGTPCQVRGLRHYLNATNTNQDLLLAVDFACHGVPSNMCFNEFVHILRKDVTNADFRYKDFSKKLMWHNMTLHLEMRDKSELTVPQHSYYYYYYGPFLDNLSLRKSCYNCNIAIHSDADISIGDFWGINKYRKEKDNNKGMSFVCIHNDKYLSLWESLTKDRFVEKLPFEAIQYQYKDKRQTRAQQLIARNNFFQQIHSIGYKKTTEGHYGKIHIMKDAVKSKVKKILRRS